MEATRSSFEGPSRSSACRRDAKELTESHVAGAHESMEALCTSGWQSGAGWARGPGMALARAKRIQKAS